MEEIRNVQSTAEQNIRRKMYNNSVLFYRMNLSTSVLEEYKNFQTGQNDIFPIPYLMTGEFEYLILNHIEKAYRDGVTEHLFAPGLMQRYQQGEMSISYEYRRQLRDETYHWVRGTANIVARAETGQIIALVYVQDIEDEKKNQAAIKSVLDEEIESIIRINVHSNMVHFVMEKRVWNGRKQGEAFLLDDSLAESMLADIVNEDREACSRFVRLENVLKRLEKQKILNITYRLWSADGRILRKKVRAMYLDDTKEDVIYVRSDITDLYEEEQRQKRRLEDAIEAANAANQAKSVFLSNVSHDMRTPLNAIISLSGEELLEDTTEEQRLDYLKKIHASGRYLLGIINNVLDMSKIENQKMVLLEEKYTLAEFADSIQTIIGEQCRQKNLKFILDTHTVEHGCVVTDKVRFNQIFVNLLGNAVKYTPEGGTIELIVEQIETNEKCVKHRFIVRDNGIGMSADFIPHAFDSFSQEKHKNHALDMQGTGLGLAIVKQIVDLMHGTIELKSELGRGTEYTIILEQPIAAEGKMAGEGIQNDKLLQGRHILLCEDHPLNMQIARMLLERKDCIVDTAVNGKLGLERFAASEEGYYDIILMDIRMPEMDGTEATAKIRALDRSDATTVPIIAMTANAFTEDAMSSLKAGMSGYLTKPINPKVFYEVLENHIVKNELML